MTKKELIDNFQKNWSGTLTPFMYEDIDVLINQDGFSPGLINEALRFTVRKGATTDLSYLIGILRNWKQRKIMTVEQVKYHEQKRQEEIDARNKPITLTTSFLDAMIAAVELWADDDGYKQREIEDLQHQKRGF